MRRANIVWSPEENELVCREYKRLFVDGLHDQRDKIPNAENKWLTAQGVLPKHRQRIRYFSSTASIQTSRYMLFASNNDTEKVKETASDQTEGLENSTWHFTQLRKPGTRISWTHEEQLAVCTAYHRILEAEKLSVKTPTSDPERWRDAQDNSSLPYIRFRAFRSSSNASVQLTVYKKFYASGALTAPEPVVVQALERKSVEALQPTQTTLDSLLAKLVESSLDKRNAQSLGVLQAMMDEHVARVDATLERHYIRMMSYWEPASSGSQELKTEIVAPVVNLPVSMTPPRKDKVCVLVSGGTNAFIAEIVERMPNIEFYHCDGQNPRSATLANKVDLAVATKWTSHSMKNKLRAKYPGRFKFVDKVGVTGIVGAIRAYFAYTQGHPPTIRA